MHMLCSYIYKDDIIGNVQPDILVYINNNCSMFFIGFLKIIVGPVLVILPAQVLS